MVEKSRVAGQHSSCLMRGGGVDLRGEMYQIEKQTTLQA